MYKRFCLFLFAFLVLFLLSNALAWHLFVRDLLVNSDGYHVGDLARLAYLPGHAAPRRNIDDLPRRHIPLDKWDGGPVDVVTVGDSFSNGGGAGLNRHYQDYVASINNLKVLNLGRLSGGGRIFEAIAALYNDGRLKKMRPQYMVVEIAERNCHRYSDPIDESSFHEKEIAPPPVVAEIRRVSDEETGAYAGVGFINTGNLKWLTYSFLYEISPKALFSSVYKVELTHELFTGKAGKTLLFFDKDYDRARKYSNKSVDGLNANLNTLARILKKDGIELVFMPAPDKYTLYSPYIEKGDWPKSPFFDLLRAQKKEYRFIDTQAILAAELKKGEQDIYYIDDTHWTWKASRAIFTRERFGSNFSAL